MECPQDASSETKETIPPIDNAVHQDDEQEEDKGVAVGQHTGSQPKVDQVERTGSLEVAQVVPSETEEALDSTDNAADHEREKDEEEQEEEKAAGLKNEKEDVETNTRDGEKEETTRKKKKTTKEKTRRS